MQLGDEKCIHTIYYVFSGRFPSEKAHSLYVAETAQSFYGKGINVSLLVPRRRRGEVSAAAFYGINEDISVIYLPTIDLYHVPGIKRFAFFLNYAVFTLGVVLLFLKKKNNDGEYIFSNEALPSLLLCLMGKQVIYEMHDYPGSALWLFEILFRKVNKIITQNNWKKQKLYKDFGVTEDKVIVEPNGVDVQFFSIPITKQEARKQLSLNNSLHIVLYSGHLFDWKGVNTLAEAAGMLDPSFQVVFVGGSDDDVVSFRKKYEHIKNIHVVGYRPHIEIPAWLKAADCLILPNSAKKEISKYFTSPMKLFEYLASGTPTIASDLPSIRAVVDENSVQFVVPDDPMSFRDSIIEVCTHPEPFKEKALKGKQLAQQYSWEKRAARILSSCCS